MTPRPSPLLRWPLLVAIAATLLVLRKPWALQTPQLWAEDGSIFLTQDEQLGIRAWWEPYNGYLHLLPRLIAWVASHTADPAWWPAIYNGLAFLLNVAVFVRLASPRIQLPAKPWLLLSFALVVGTGEVLINVTNLQWMTAFLLVLQLFAAPAATPLQRWGDQALLLVVGLNGPFALLFLPLFAWRAWRDRTLDTVLALATVGLGAAVAGLCLARSGAAMNLAETREPFHPLMFFSLIGSRLVTWPLFGPAAVFAWPKAVHAVLGGVVLAPLLLGALRPAPHRRERMLVAVLFGLVLVAGLWRVRADTWERDDLVNGDRYFFIPRVLLAWLLIWETSGPSRWVAWTARCLCLVAVLQHAARFTLPAPPDYQWAQHCDPIRRGVPANIFTLPEGWWIEYPGRPERK